MVKGLSNAHGALIAAAAMDLQIDKWSAPPLKNPFLLTLNEVTQKAILLGWCKVAQIAHLQRERHGPMDQLQWLAEALNSKARAQNGVALYQSRKDSTQRVGIVGSTQLMTEDIVVDGSFRI